MEQTIPSFRIRMAVPKDAPSIASVLHESFMEYKSHYTPEGFAATTPASKQIQNRLKEGPVWVVLHQDAIIGTVSVVPKGEALYVRGMALLPAARGQRIGEMLLRQIESYAAEQGIKRLFLSTTPFLKHAIELYEQYGFRRSREGPDNLYGTALFTMKKDLESSLRSMVECQRCRLTTH